MADVRMSLEEYERLRAMAMDGDCPTCATEEATTPPEAKKKRKVSKYQRAFGKHLKKLKRAHPKTQAKTLMKRAHRLTKKQLK